MVHVHVWLGHCEILSLNRIIAFTEFFYAYCKKWEIESVVSYSWKVCFIISTSRVLCRFSTMPSKIFGLFAHICGSEIPFTIVCSFVKSNISFKSSPCPFCVDHVKVYTGMKCLVCACSAAFCIYWLSLEGHSIHSAQFGHGWTSFCLLLMCVLTILYHLA